jgi:hypothetical protein
MKLELKKISVHAQLSEETPCYTANLFVDGKLFGHVSNHGHGGPDMIYPANDVAPNDPKWNARLKEIDKWVQANDANPTVINDMEIRESLESWCHGQAFDEIEKRNLRSRLNRAVLMVEDGKVFSFKGRKSPQLIEAVKKKYPLATILNELSFADAFKQFKQYA